MKEDSLASANSSGCQDYVNFILKIIYMITINNLFPDQLMILYITVTKNKVGK